MTRVVVYALAISLASTAFVFQPREKTTIVWEAENFAEIGAPMRITRAIAHASALASVEIPLGAGQGWRGQGGGHMTYRVEVPKAGAYRLWGRALWKDGCTNAYFVSAGEGPRLIFGNDPIFGAWHWVRGQNLDLRAGVNYVRFSNHSDGTALDKLVLTDDPHYFPDGLGDEISRFYDGFAGCDGDNTGSWELQRGKWRVVASVGEAAAGVNDSLAQWDLNGGEIWGGFSVWHDYDLSVMCMPTGPGTIALIAFRNEDGGHIRLEWEIGEKLSRVRIVQADKNGRAVLAESEEILCVADRWYTLGLALDGRAVTAFLDRRSVAHSTLPTVPRGRIGLASSGMAAAYFDNVQANFHGNR